MIKELFKNQNIFLTPISIVLGYLIFLSNIFNFNKTYWLISGFVFIIIYSFKFYIKKSKEWPDYYRLCVVLIFGGLILGLQLTKKSFVFDNYVNETLFYSYLLAYLYAFGLVLSIIKAVFKKK